MDLSWIPSRQLISRRRQNSPSHFLEHAARRPLGCTGCHIARNLGRPGIAVAVVLAFWIKKVMWEVACSQGRLYVSSEALYLEAKGFDFCLFDLS